MAKSDIDNNPLNEVFDEDELYLPTLITRFKFNEIIRKNSQDKAKTIIFSIKWKNNTLGRVEINFGTNEDIEQNYTLFLDTAKKNNPKANQNNNSNEIPVVSNAKISPAPPVNNALNPGVETDNNPDDLMKQLIKELQKKLSNHVWMGLGRNRKHQALERLLNSNDTLENKYQKLINITTTQRTRFGLFYYAQRTNSSSTNTAFALSNKLFDEKYAGLKTALSINVNTAAELRQQFNAQIGTIDFYTQEPTKFSNN